MGKARKPPVPKPPPPGCCRDGDIRWSVCADGTTISGWECIGCRWVRTDDKCPEIPPPPEAFCCNLIEAVVFLNRCMSFWVGECNAWTGLVPGPLPPGPPVPGLPPAPEPVSPCPFPDVDVSKPHECYRGILIGLYWSDIAQRSIWTKNVGVHTFSGEVGCGVAGYNTLAGAKMYIDTLISLGLKMPAQC